MELLTRNNFEDWMQKLMERLDRQDELLLTLRPSGKAPNPMESIRMFDNQDLCMLLQISKRTLQRYRSIGALPYKTLGKKTYYSEEDVLTFLSEHVKDFRKESYRPPLDGEHYLTDKEVAEMLRVSRRTLQEYRNNRMLPFILLAGKVLYPESGLRELLEANYLKPLE